MCRPDLAVRWTRAHLYRLANLEDANHGYFARPDGQPEYSDRRMLVVLAQGTALGGRPHQG
jgi:hypothetical protein